MSPRPGKTQASALVAFLADCPLFQNVRPEALRAFLRSAGIRRVRRGDVLFRQGRTSTRVYVLLEGLVTLVRMTPKGHRLVLRFLRPGDVFGCIDIYGRAEETYTAQVAREGRVLSWSRNGMRRMIERHPLIKTNVLRMMARRIQAYWARVEDLATAPVERRVARTLLSLTNDTNCEVSVLHRDLAGFVGTTPPTLSRILRQWERRGLVSGGRASLQLRARDCLRAIAADP